MGNSGKSGINSSDESTAEGLERRKSQRKLTKKAGAALPQPKKDQRSLIKTLKGQVKTKTSGNQADFVLGRRKRGGRVARSIKFGKE